MSNDPIANYEQGFLKREPALVTSAVLAVLTAAGTFATAHGLIGHAQASVIVQALLPAVSGVAILGAGLVIRKLVVPAFAVAERIEAAVLSRINGGPAGG